MGVLTDSATGIVNPDRLVAIYTSAARTTAPDGVAVTNYAGARGAVLQLDVTAAAGGQTVTGVALQQLVGATYKTINEWTALSLGAGQHALLIYPTAGAMGGYAAAPINGVLPKALKVVLTHGNSNSITYTLDLCWLP